MKRSPRPSTLAGVEDNTRLPAWMQSATMDRPVMVLPPPVAMTTMGWVSEVGSSRQAR